MDRQTGLVDFLALEVCPALFDRLDRAFPEFGWTRTGRGWKATNREYTKATFGVRPDRVVCNRSLGFLVYGQGTTNWISYISNGTSPTGRDFVEAAHKLAGLAGVDAAGLDLPWTAEEAVENPAADVCANCANLEKLKTPLRPERPGPEPQVEHVRNVVDEVQDHAERLDRYAGREFIGLPQRTLETLDEVTLGLRGLMLLAAAPSDARTALAIQFGTDVVVHNEDACLLFVSLEMSRWDILTRMKSRLAGMDWEKLVLGSGKGPDEAAFTMDELADIEEAEQMMAEIGRRVRILDEQNCPQPTVETVLEHLSQLKAKSGANRAFVLVNHLQLWPIADHQLRDAAEGDAVMVVSEARGSISPDIALLLRPFDEHELRAAYTTHHGQLEGKSEDEQSNAARQWRDALEREGINLHKLAIADGRDGVQKAVVDLSFHFRRFDFEEGLPKWDCWA